MGNVCAALVCGAVGNVGGRVAPGEGPGGGGGRGEKGSEDSESGWELHLEFGLGACRRGRVSREYIKRKRREIGGLLWVGWFKVCDQECSGVFGMMEEEDGERRTGREILIPLLDTTIDILCWPCLPLRTPLPAYALPT